jgi:hypothetical protein
MGYYQGDFYAGARGDPFWGALMGGAIRMGKGLLGKGGGFLAKHYPPALSGSGTIATAAGAGAAIMKRGGAMIMKHPVLSAAGAAGALGTVGLASHMHHKGAEMMGFGACPKGHHISKKSGACVKNRRMNVANGRALGRAVRRLHHFAKKYRKVVGFVSPKRPKGRMYFKKRKSK